MIPSKIWGTMRVQKAAEKSINTYNGQNKKGFGPYDHQPRKNLHTAMSVTKHDQTMILAHMYDKSRYNDGNCIPIVLHPITLHVCVFFSRSHWWRSRTPSFLLFIYVNVSVYGLNKHFYFKTFFETIIIIKA